MRGRLLKCETMECTAQKKISISLPENVLNVSFVSEEGWKDISRLIEHNGLDWCPDFDGQLVFIWSEIQEYSLDPMHPLSGQKVCEKFFGVFEEHFPEECGKDMIFVPFFRLFLWIWGMKHLKFVWITMM